MRKINLLFFVHLILTLAMFTGCQQGRVPPEGLPKLYRCEIKITQEDIPLQDTIVALHSTSGAVQWTISGKTNAAGVAGIYTQGYFKGAPLGTYKVTVQKMKTVAPPLPEILPKNPNDLTKLYNKIEEETRDYNLIAPEYAQPETTSLEIIVQKKFIETSFDVGKPAETGFTGTISSVKLFAGEVLSQ